MRATDLLELSERLARGDDKSGAGRGESCARADPKKAPRAFLTVYASRRRPPRYRGGQLAQPVGWLRPPIGFPE